MNRFEQAFVSLPVVLLMPAVLLWLLFPVLVVVALPVLPLLFS